MSTNWFILLAILVGLVVVFGGCVLRITYRQRMQRMMSARFEKALGELDATRGADDPTILALHDLKRRFDRGLKVYARHGMDVYSLPWYLMLGEPGVGKTEAIRHSKLSFPAGLNDAVQGTGGTFRLDWWFSNEAVFLDTAGRMVWGGEEAGYSELLKLLRQARPRCPINGIFLFVATDELLKKTPDEVITKGRRISGQLESLQRWLALPLDVYVVVTKCDLLPGYGSVLAEANTPARI